MTIESLSNPSHALVITDASIKNNIATSIFHIHIRDKPIIKTLYHAVNITSIKAELFTIRCSVNQATNVIAQGCGQTLGLGLGQSKDIVVVFY